MANKTYKTLILGYFGYRTNQLDGQTVKTRNILHLLNSKLRPNSVEYFDTEELHYKKSSIFTMLKLVCRCHKLVYIPAHNNLKYFAFPLYILSILFHFKVIHVSVGGWLTNFLQKHSLTKYAVSNYEVILTQAEIDKEHLTHQFGFHHVLVFPNFRVDSCSPPFAKTHDLNRASIFRIVFMARINKKKGLDWMDILASHIEDNYAKGNVIIDFYGPLFEGDKAFFSEMLSRHPMTMNYKGALNPSEIVQILSDYDVLVLPTHYYTEGFPGSILDAYRSGIPVIVTEWQHAKQFVRNGETGCIIPFKNGENELCKKVDLLINNPEKLKYLKKQALKESLLYTQESAWKIIKEYLV